MYIYLYVQIEIIYVKYVFNYIVKFKYKDTLLKVKL